MPHICSQNITDNSHPRRNLRLCKSTACIPLRVYLSNFVVVISPNMATPSISSIDPRDQYRALYDVYLQSLQALHDHNSSVPHQLRANRVIELHAQLELLRTPTASTPTSLASGGSTTAGSTADAHAATYNLVSHLDYDGDGLGMRLLTNVLDGASSPSCSATLYHSIPVAAIHGLRHAIPHELPFGIHLDLHLSLPKHRPRTSHEYDP